MDWSRMFTSQVVVLGCGNTLFGDDGLAPRVTAQLAAEVQEAEDAGLVHELAHVAFVDAGTSIRPLLMDLALHPAPHLRKVIVLDIVQEEGREPGSLVHEDLDAHHDGDPAGGFLHHAPTWGLLRKLRQERQVEVHVLTVQAAHIPELMDETLSPAAAGAFAPLSRAVRELSLVSTGE